MDSKERSAQFNEKKEDPSLYYARRMGFAKQYRKLNEYIFIFTGIHLAARYDEDAVSRGITTWQGASCRAAHVAGATGVDFFVSYSRK